jgi:hypothetical protein
MALYGFVSCPGWAASLTLTDKGPGMEQRLPEQRLPSHGHSFPDFDIWIKRTRAVGRMLRTQTVSRSGSIRALDVVLSHAKFRTTLH